MMKTDYGAQIYIRFLGESTDKSWRMTLASEIASIIDYSGKRELRYFYQFDGFSIKLNENESGDGPWYYFAQDWERDWYFNFTIHYNTKIVGIDGNLPNLKKILAYFWTRGFPAAIESPDLPPGQDYESHLPMQGGNDLDQVFWRDDHLAFRKKAGMESYLGPPIND